MMKIRPVLIHISVLLLFSCSNDNPVPEAGESIEMPVSIEISKGKKQISRATDHEWGMAGTCNADKVMLLVFKGPKGAKQADVKDFNYISRQILDCRESGEQRIARGTITGEADATYAVFAIAYNNAAEAAHFTITDTTTTYGDVKIQLIPTAGGARPDSYYTPELFVGHVTSPGSTTWVFTADGKTRLGGVLYRAVGKCTFSVKDIPANIRKVEWITGEMTNYSNIYNPDMMFDEYPMAFPGSDKQLKKASQVASAERGSLAEGVVSWNAAMESFFIPLKESLFFIDATDDEGVITRYLVKCPDRWEYTIWIGIINVIVSEYKFSVAPNWLIEIAGTYSQLKNSGNMVIDLTEVTSEYDGGILPPAI